ncbi:MAG: restriction endonuclease subunit S [Lamprobacter sp.]|uniref:restriction endonuclease subunit S n=1 Tax=Lamprobacter sp. TaxID=3100796 RepID=UPI002B25B032|nr:restriction endonuclease subunit S [Lamprobacter sp.]MEA3643519.1 restriction endonuclease subunit S [Lamprobacter sp.]
MSWRAVRLGELIDIKHGFAFKSKYFTDEGKYILLTPGNCHETGGLKLKGDKEKYYSGEVPADFLLAAGDLLVVMTDLVNTAPILGGAFIIPEDDRFLHNQRLGLISLKDTSRIQKAFLYYLLNTKGYRAQVRGSASGATVRHTSPDRIKQCVVRVPNSLDEQSRIASILSAYDDLIENNRRRIQLLEQAARLLYKEWFVHLRFPGHEHVTITDGVPEGWEKKPLGEHVTLKYGKALKADSRVDGSYPVYGSSGIVGTHEKPFVKGPGIIVGRKGNVGSVYWSSCDFYPIDTVYFIDADSSDFYLYHALAHMHFISTDVAVPGLNRDFAHSRNLLFPPEILHREFLDAVSPMHQQMDKLNQANEKLRAARDLLLPRLMNGEITV